MESKDFRLINLPVLQVHHSLSLLTAKLHHTLYITGLWSSELSQCRLSSLRRDCNTLQATQSHKFISIMQEFKSAGTHNVPHWQLVNSGTRNRHSLIPKLTSKSFSYVPTPYLTPQLPSLCSNPLPHSPTFFPDSSHICIFIEPSSYLILLFIKLFPSVFCSIFRKRFARSPHHIIFHPLGLAFTPLPFTFPLVCCSCKYHYNFIPST